MNSKQWVWVYGKIKELFSACSGHIPDDQAASSLMALYEYVGSVTDKSRQEDREMDEELRNLFNYLFDIFHSLEVEGKEV